MRNASWIRLLGRVAMALLLALFCAGSFARTAVAQTAEESVEEEVQPVVDLAPVVVDGDELFFVIGVSAESAEKRAADIAERIVAVAETGLSAPSFTVEATEFRSGDLYGWGLHRNRDAGRCRLRRLGRTNLGKEGWGENSRGDRSLPRTAVGGWIYETSRDHRGQAGHWLFVAFSVALWLGTRYLRKRADRRIVSWVQRVEDSTGKIVETDTIVSTTRATLWATSFFIFVIALYYYLSQILFSFPWNTGDRGCFARVFYRAHFPCPLGHHRGRSPISSCLPSYASSPVIFSESSG